MKLKRLKEIRQANNLTQFDVATAISIDRTTYASYELGRDTISIERLNDFCNFFNISIDYVLEFTDILHYSESNKNIDIKTVAERLKQTRKENNLTQDYVANLLNTNHSVWCRYEQAKYLINTSFLYSYAKTINISADYLLSKVNSPKYLK